MVNPFKKLKEEQRAKEIMQGGWEEVDGPMACQTFGCRGVARTGLYSVEAKVVTWKCPEGHVSSMKNFEA